MIDNRVLKEKANALPDRPGVYLMKDSIDNIIYIGKAKNLKNRVRQYFMNSKNRSPKVEKLILNVSDFEYIITDTELEALIMECALIKQEKPFYNKLMKNEKAYVYIKINLQEQIPGLNLVYEKLEDESVYFGPYTSASVVESAIEAFKEFTSIRRCNKVLSNKNMCFYYRGCKCSELCNGNGNREEYLITINNIIEFLKGKDFGFFQLLQKEMEIASENLNFEKAGKIRDYVKALKGVIAAQNTIKDSNKRKYIIALQSIDENSYKIFLIYGNRLVNSLIIGEEALINHELVEHVIFRSGEHWGSRESLESWARNDENTVTKEELDEQQIIFSYLKSKRETVKYRQIPYKYIKAKDYKFISEVLNGLRNLQNNN